MNKNLFHGIAFTISGSLWWGIVGVFYFKHVSFVSPIELVAHRTIWTAFLLFFSTTFLFKWNIFLDIFKDKKKILLLFLSGILIFINWGTWIYAVVNNKLIDAAFGYYIFPILSVFFGIMFFNESYNKKKILSILLVILSITYLLIKFDNIPWVGLIVAFTWSIYNLVRKKVNVPADLGLFAESIFITPLALVIFYFITIDGNNFFSPNDLKISFWLFLAGFITVVPLFFYLKGAELAGLGTAGMIFFVTPTCQFLLGVLYFNEVFNTNTFISFILIWIAVIIYLTDLNYKKNY